jgi:hypothetical protein
MRDRRYAAAATGRRPPSRWFWPCQSELSDLLRGLLARTRADSRSFAPSPDARAARRVTALALHAAGVTAVAAHASVARSTGPISASAQRLCPSADAAMPTHGLSLPRSTQNRKVSRASLGPRRSARQQDHLLRRRAGCPDRTRCGVITMASSPISRLVFLFVVLWKPGSSLSSRDPRDRVGLLPGDAS